MKPAILVLIFSNRLSEPSRVQCMFNSGDDAREAQAAVAAAAKSFHDRTNDRERMFTFEDVSGPVTLDLSEITAIGVDDPMGRAKDALGVWNKAMAINSGLLAAAKEYGKTTFSPSAQ